MCPRTEAFRKGLRCELGPCVGRACWPPHLAPCRGDSQALSQPRGDPPRAAHPGLHVKPVLLPREWERSRRSPRRLGSSWGMRVLFLEVQAVLGVSPVPSLSS